MPNRNARIRRVSRRQLDVLWEFLNSHRDIATAYNRSIQAKEYSKGKWSEIAEVLNAHGDGTHKKWNEWSKYWVDYKAKLKKRMSALRLSQSATGGGASTEQPLTEIDLKYLQILGVDFGQGLPDVHVEPLPENTKSTVDDALSEPILKEPLMVIPTQVKQEASLEEPAEEVPLKQEAEATEHSYSRNDALTPSAPPAPAPTPASAARPPRRRRPRRDPPMSQEAARRALVESSRMRAEAAVRSSHALENIMNTLQRIERRVRKKPDPSKRVQCDQCSKTYANNCLLKRHMLSHKGERPYMCMECGKTYTQIGHLSNHEMKHNGVKNFNCTECNSAFYRKAELDRHRKIHTGEKNYSCEFCSKSFVQKNNLVMHVKMHLGDRRFECVVCNKKFITNSKLVQHSKRHTKDKKKKSRHFVMMHDDDDGSVLSEDSPGQLG